MSNQPIKQAIREADHWARKEFIQFGVPIWAYETANMAGHKLAKHFKVDGNIIMLGTILADIALGKALHQNKLKQHVQMSYNAAKKFLDKYNIPVSDKKKILDGVKYHHGTIKFPCLESEIIANADCYKFLKLANIKTYYQLLEQERGSSPEASLNGVKYKFNEKRHALSLEYCQKDLKPEILSIEKFLAKIETKIINKK